MRTISPPPAQMSLNTLGTLSMRFQETEFKGIGSGKQAALFVYLVLQPGPHRRDLLADLFWPDAPVDSGRLNLRQTLFGLRAWLRTHADLPYIASDRNQVGLIVGANFATDIELLSKANEKAQNPKDEQQVALMESALASYRGPFLQNVDLKDCPAFMDWLTNKRESLHQQALQLTRRLIEAHAQRGSTHEAIKHSRRYQELEPWDETGYWWAIHLQAMIKQKDMAIDTFQTYRKIIERDLNILPSKSLSEFVKTLTTAQSRVDFPEKSGNIQEYRQISVLYCTYRALGFNDTEEAIVHISGPQAESENIIRSMGGHAIPVEGGGILAYFGYPQALDDTDLFAMRAAERINKLATPLIEVSIDGHSGLILTDTDITRPVVKSEMSNEKLIFQKIRQQANTNKMISKS